MAIRPSNYKKWYSLRYLYIYLYFHNISINYLTVQYYYFCSVFTSEYKSFKAIVPFKELLNSAKRITVPIRSAVDASIFFQVLLRVCKDKDNFIKLQIRPKKWYPTDFYLKCTISGMNKNGDILLSKNDDYLFRGEYKCVWNFTLFENEDLHRLFDGLDVLSLDCVARMPHQNSITWLQESGTIQNEQMNPACNSTEKTSLREDLLAFYLEGKGTDIVLDVGNKQLPAHKSILCARSPVFKSWFKNKMSDSFKISDVDGETMDLILKYIYSEISEDSDLNNLNTVMKLYLASDTFQIGDLKNKCLTASKALLSNDCQIENVRETVNFKLAKNKVNNLSEDFLHVYLKQQFTDIDFNIGNQVIPAHKAILSARSDYFKEFFVFEKKHDVLDIHGLDFDTAHRLFIYIYSGKLEDWDLSDLDIVIKWYVASSVYRIMVLKRRYSSMLASRLSLENVYDILNVADEYSDSDLLKCGNDFILANAKVILNSKKWVLFMNKNPKVACDVMHNEWLERNSTDD